MTDLDCRIDEALDETTLENEEFLSFLYGHGLSIVFTEDKERLERVKKLFADLATFGYEDVVARSMFKALREALK